MPVARPLVRRTYNNIVWRLRGCANVVYKTLGPLNGKFMLGCCLGPYVAIHKTAKDNLSVWHHELGHAIVNTHYGNHQGSFLNRRENEAFACTYEYMHWVLRELEKDGPLPNNFSFTDQAINFFVNSGVATLDYRMEHGNGKKGYASLNRYVVRKDRLQTALRYAIRSGLVCDGAHPVVDGWNIINPWNNRRKRKG